MTELIRATNKSDLDRLLQFLEEEGVKWYDGKLPTKRSHRFSEIGEVVLEVEGQVIKSMRSGKYGNIRNLYPDKEIIEASELFYTPPEKEEPEIDIVESVEVINLDNTDDKHNKVLEEMMKGFEYNEKYAESLLSARRIYGEAAAMAQLHRRMKELQWEFDNGNNLSESLYKLANDALLLLGEEMEE